MKKLFIISLLSISLPTLAQEPEDSTNLNSQEIMELNFSKPDMNHRIGIDVDSFNVPPKNSGSGNSDPVTPVEPTGKWVDKKIYYRTVESGFRRKTTYCGNTYHMEHSVTRNGTRPRVPTGVCRTDRVFVEG